MSSPRHPPFLKWAGGKRRLSAQICTQLPDADTLVEPFVGAGAIFLASNYKRYLLCDINPDLINLFNIVKQQPEQYIADARKLFIPAYNDKSHYLALRHEFNQSTDKYRRALLFLYLNKHGYNGLCRYNKTGGFNVPFGRYVAPKLPENALWYFAEKAQQATFVCQSYQQTFAELPEDAVIYCDPPYAPLSQTSNFTDYSKDGFSQQDQQQLASLACQAAQQRGIQGVLLSNHDSPFTREIYQGADLTSLMASRFISQDSGTRNKVGELLALYQGKQN